MKTIPYRDAWGWLDEYRGTEFEGRWPNLREFFHINRVRYPDNTVFKVFNPKEETFTYAEAEKKILEVANYLVANGVKPDDKIGVSGKNSPEWAIAYFAVAYTGAIVVPLDYALHDNEMEKLIEFGDVTRLFIDAERIKNIDKDGKLNLIKYALEPTDEYPFVLDLDGPSFYYERKKGDDVAAILFTSGTTGTPKGVMLTNDNLIADCYLAQSNMLLFPTDVFYAILPIHHAYTMLAVMFEAISCGCSIVFGKKLVVSQMLKELKEGQVTMFLGVPLLFNKLIAGLMGGIRKKGIVVYGLIRGLMKFSGFLKKAFGFKGGKKWFKFLLKNISLDNARICICGGGPLPASTFKQFNELGIDFVQGYGLTETSPITHLNPIEAYREDSVGRNNKEVEVKIVDPDSDGNGMIYLRGPMIMKGYYKNPEATAEVLSEDGWLNTGDVGHEDEDGYLYLTGRAKNVIVTEGGKNVFPEEIEDKFQLYDDVAQICVIGYIIDPATKSEGIRAIVRPSAALVKEFDEQGIERRIGEVIEEVNKTLQSYKKITRTTIVSEPLPLTSTSKIKRFEVIEKYGKD